MKKYEILEKLGEGGIGIVFRAVQRGLDREVAIKFLGGQYVEDPVMCERFEREVEAATRVSHPSIVKIIDHGRSDGQPYYVMEYVRGETLRERIKGQGPLPPAQVEEVLVQLLDALAACHRAGYVHRDVKPANVMVTPEGRVVLMDFGLVRPPAGTMITADGRILGTPTYMAPELLDGGIAGPPADVHALGILAYEMLRGDHAYQATTLPELIHAVLAGPPPPLSSARPGLPPALVSFVERCITREPALRFPSAVEALDAFAGAATTSGLSSQSLGVQSLGRPPSPVDHGQEPHAGFPRPPGGREPRPARAPPPDRPGRARPPVLAAGLSVGLALLIGMGIAWLIGRTARPPALPPGALTVAPGVGMVTVSWSSDRPYAGRVQVAPATGEGASSTVQEGTPTTRHVVAADGLAVDMRLRATAEDDTGAPVGSVEFVAGSLTEMGADARERLGSFDAEGLLAELTAEVDRLPLSLQLSARGPMEGIRRVWSRRIAERARGSGLAGALARLRAAREEVFGAERLELRLELALARHVHRLMDLAYVAGRLAVEVGFDVRDLLPAHVAPGASPALGRGEGIGVVFDPDFERSFRSVGQRWTVVPTGLTKSLTLYAPGEGTWPDFERLSAQSADIDRMVAAGRLEVRIERAVTLPAGRDLVAIEAILDGKSLGDGKSVALLWSHDRRTYGEVAVFRAPERGRFTIGHRLDRRLVSARRVHLGLRFRYQPFSAYFNTCSIRGLALRFDRLARGK